MGLDEKDAIVAAFQLVVVLERFLVVFELRRRNKFLQRHDSSSLRDSHQWIATPSISINFVGLAVNLV